MFNQISCLCKHSKLAVIYYITTPYMVYVIIVTTLCLLCKHFKLVVIYSIYGICYDCNCTLFVICSLCKQVQIESNIDNGTSIEIKGFPQGHWWNSYKNYGTSREYLWESHRSQGVPIKILVGLPQALWDFQNISMGIPQ